MLFARRSAGPMSSGTAEDMARGHDDLHMEFSRFAVTECGPRGLAAGGCQAETGGPRALADLTMTPSAGRTAGGTRTCRNSAGSSTATATPTGLGLAAGVPHRLQCSQAREWTGPAGAWSEAASPPLWQITDNGSAAAPGADVEITPQSAVCRPIAMMARGPAILRTGNFIDSPRGLRRSSRN